MRRLIAVAALILLSNLAIAGADDDLQDRLQLYPQILDEEAAYNLHQGLKKSVELLIPTIAARAYQLAMLFEQQPFDQSKRTEIHSQLADTGLLVASSDSEHDLLVKNSTLERVSIQLNYDQSQLTGIEWHNQLSISDVMMRLSPQLGLPSNHPLTLDIATYYLDKAAEQARSLDLEAEFETDILDISLSIYRPVPNRTTTYGR